MRISALVSRKKKLWIYGRQRKQRLERALAERGKIKRQRNIELAKIQRLKDLNSGIERWRKGMEGARQEIAAVLKKLDETIPEKDRQHLQRTENALAKFLPWFETNAGSNPGARLKTIQFADTQLSKTNAKATDIRRLKDAITKYYQSSEAATTLELTRHFAKTEKH